MTRFLLGLGYRLLSLWLPNRHKQNPLLEVSRAPSFHPMSLFCSFFFVCGFFQTGFLCSFRGDQYFLLNTKDPSLITRGDRMTVNMPPSLSRAAENQINMRNGPLPSTDNGVAASGLTALLRSAPTVWCQASLGQASGQPRRQEWRQVPSPGP